MTKVSSSLMTKATLSAVSLFCLLPFYFCLRARARQRVTTTVPDMPSPPLPPWKAQWYGYVPGFVNLRLKVLPAPSVGDSNEPSSAVTVWLLLPSLVQGTVAPALAVNCPG